LLNQVKDSIVIAIDIYNKIVKDNTAQQDKTEQ
jgi:hypothetical protein